LNPEELSPQEQEYLQTHDEKVNWIKIKNLKIKLIRICLTW
jgi:hypothetical protein